MVEDLLLELGDHAKGDAEIDVRPGGLGSNAEGVEQDTVEMAVGREALLMPGGEGGFAGPAGLEWDAVGAAEGERFDEAPARCHGMKVR